MRPAVRPPGRRRRCRTDTSKARTHRSAAVNESFGSDPPPPAPTCRRPRTTPIRDTHNASCRSRASRRRTTHVVDPLPARVRLVDAPGELRDVELAVLGWRMEDGEVALCCRLIDGSAGTIPARWTDLPRRVGDQRRLVWSGR